MFFFFVCGEHTFRKEVKGYEGLVCQCHHCGNVAGHVIKSNPFFTLCFIPIIPLSISGYKDVSCRICHFNQPLEHRPDVMNMAKDGGGQPQQYQGPPQPPEGQQPHGQQPHGQQPQTYG